MVQDRPLVSATPDFVHEDIAGRQELYRLSDRAFYLYGRGYLTAESLDGVLRAAEALELRPPYSSYIDWFDLVGYELAARHHAQAWCDEHNTHPDTVYFGTCSKIVWMGVYIVNLKMRSKLRPCKSIEELAEKLEGVEA